MMLAILAVAAEAKPGLPQLNPLDFSPQLIWLAASFLALYLLLSRVALPRVGEVIEERQERIQRDLGAAERLKGETQKALEGYEQALAAARTKAGGIAKDTRDRLAADVERERARIEKETNAKIAEAEGRIAAAKSKALASVNDIAAETAGAIVARILGQSAGADEVRQALPPLSAK